MCQSETRAEWIDHALDSLLRREVVDGGFSLYPSCPFDPVATAWAAICLVVYGISAETSLRACEALKKAQAQDGRISVNSQAPWAYWPTSIAVMAFSLHQRGFEVSRHGATQFLLVTSGLHWKKTFDQALGHDTNLPGWSWAELTHSWVQPTSLAMIALRCSGLDDHPRIRQGKAMLLDRQLPEGGWNYGNPKVFGKDLLNCAESTGHALAALAGVVERSSVDRSLARLRMDLESIRTPLTLSWGLMALAAWGQRPADADSRLEESFRLQDRYGVYDTSLLAQMAISFRARDGLLPLLKTEGGP